MLTATFALTAFLANLIPATAFAAVQADPKVQLKGATTWTAVSGDTGNAEVTLGRTANFHASYAIVWWEDSDDPCKFELVTKHMNRGGEDGPDAEWCQGSPGDAKAAFRLGQDQYITALQICRTDKGDETRDKIKGLRVWGRTVDKKKATLGPETGPDEDDHAHCKVWENKVACPAGQVASRIKVHYQKYWSNYTDSWLDYGYATGISLGCRKVIAKEASEDDTKTIAAAPIDAPSALLQVGQVPH